MQTDVGENVHSSDPFTGGNDLPVTNDNSKKMNEQSLISVVKKHGRRNPKGKNMVKEQSLQSKKNKDDFDQIYKENLANKLNVSEPQNYLRWLGFPVCKF